MNAPALLFATNALAGWLGFLAGALSGAAIGLFFHRETWLGGYGSFPRRMLRLGHIACFGLGLLNLLFALTVNARGGFASAASVLLLVGLFTMPTTCFVTAFRPGFRRFFFVPAGATLAGVVAVILQLL